MFGEKIDQARKENVKLLICNFIDGLNEDDELFIVGNVQSDMFTNKVKSEMSVMAKKLNKEYI